MNLNFLLAGWALGAAGGWEIGGGNLFLGAMLFVAGFCLATR